MRKLTTRSILCGLAVASFAFPGAAEAARSCDAPDYPSSGYFAKLTVSGTKCSVGRRVAREHYKCRIRNGGRDGRCSSRRRLPSTGYRCKETDRQRISTQLSAKVSCRRGDRRVRFIYQQDL